jgi:cell division transport system permease protein
MLRSDLPLDRNAAGLFLPAIIGFMVFLGALAFAGSMAVDNLLAHWQGSIEAAFTVQLPTLDGEDAAGAAKRRKAALAAIVGVPGIESATLLTDADKARLLAPWLGAGAAGLDLPLPDLIAVTTAPGGAVDLAALTEKLRAASPALRSTIAARWRMPWRVSPARPIWRFWGRSPSFGGALTVVFVACWLAAHGRIIEIPSGGRHATSRAIQRHAFTQICWAVIGAGVAACVFLAAERWLPGLGAGELALRPLQWAALALLPVLAALLAMATARYTVLRSLRRIL